MGVVIWGIDPNGDLSGGFYEQREIPVYLNDLNAMAEARKTLTKHEKLVYQEAIFDAMYAAGKYDGGFASWHYIDAGAAEHADAFLMAKGLLK